MEYVPAGVARLLGLGGEGVGVLPPGLVLLLDDEPPHAIRNGRRAIKTRITPARRLFLSIPPNKTIAGRTNHSASQILDLKSAGKRDADAPVVLTVTWTGNVPDEVAATVCGEKEHLAPTGNWAQERANVWFASAVPGANVKSSDPDCPAASDKVCWVATNGPAAVVVAAAPRIAIP